MTAAIRNVVSVTYNSRLPTAREEKETGEKTMGNKDDDNGRTGSGKCERSRRRAQGPSLHVPSRLVVSSRGHRGLVWPVSSLGVSDLAFLFADMLNGVDIDHRPVACSLVSPLFIGQGSSWHRQWWTTAAGLIQPFSALIREPSKMYSNDRLFPFLAGTAWQIIINYQLYSLFVSPCRASLTPTLAFG